MKRRYRSAVMSVDVLGGIGWQWVCDCGERGSRRDTYAEARHELNAHRREAH